MRPSEIKKSSEVVRELVEKALLAKGQAYSPYSGFRVGAALLTSENTLFTGCNVENGSYSLTICAERNAVFKAVSEGSREFLAIAIVSDDKNFLPPCGACRQVLFEFAPETKIILTTPAGDVKVTSLAKLLPMAANLKKLGKHGSKKL